MHENLRMGCLDMTEYLCKVYLGDELASICSEHWVRSGAMLSAIDRQSATGSQQIKGWSIMRSGCRLERIKGGWSFGGCHMQVAGKTIQERVIIQHCWWYQSDHLAIMSPVASISKRTALMTTLAISLYYIKIKKIMVIYWIRLLTMRFSFY